MPWPLPHIKQHTLWTVFVTCRIVPSASACSWKTWRLSVRTINEYFPAHLPLRAKVHFSGSDKQPTLSPKHNSYTRCLVEPGRSFCTFSLAPQGIFEEPYKPYGEKLASLMAWIAKVYKARHAEASSHLEDLGDIYFLVREFILITVTPSSWTHTSMHSSLSLQILLCTTKNTIVCAFCFILHTALSTVRS